MFEGITVIMDYIYPKWYLVVTKIIQILES